MDENLEKCRSEIKEVLEKYDCKLKVSALLQTEGTQFKVDVIKKEKQEK